MRRILSGLLALLCCLTMSFPALAEVAFLPTIDGWELDAIPLELTLSADVTAYAPFGEDRLPQLTSLMKHLSLRITRQPLMDETQSTVSVLVDGEEALSLSLQENDQIQMVQFSPIPDVTYIGDDPLALLLGTSSEPFTICGLDGSEIAWLTEGEALVNVLEAILAPYLKSETAIKTAIKDMGTARLKQDYTIPKDEAGSLTALLADACPDGRLKELISGLVFSGKQTLRVYRDEDHRPLRLEWTGHLGPDEDHLRNVTLTWRMRRDDTAYRDEISLNAPALKGTDNNKLTWSCAIAPDKKTGSMVLSGSLSYTRTANKQKTTLTGEFKLTAAKDGYNTRLTGTATIKRQLPGEDSAVGCTFEPDLLVWGGSESPAVDGTLTVSSLSGKKTLDQATVTLSLRRIPYASGPLRQQTVDLTALDSKALEATRQQVNTAIASAFLRRLVQLPREDLDYLFMDLPEETVQTLISVVQSD